MMVMKSLFRCLIGLTVLTLISSVCFAQTPVSISLDLNKDYYQLGEDVLADIRVWNTTGSEVLINQGFPGTVFIEEVSVIDPAGRQSGSVKLVPPPVEEPDAPPVPVILRGGQSVSVIGWTTLAADWQVETGEQILSDYHPMDLPGWYSAQVQVTIMTFKPEDPGSIRNFEYQGVVKSNTVYFYKEGATEVNVLPKWWRIVWQEGRYLLPNVKVAIWPTEGLDVANYEKASIRLNNVDAVKVKMLYSWLKKQYYLLAFFNKQDAINALGEVQVGQWHPVVLSGKLTNGQFFGGAYKIKIIR
jgi:hypothetical protein